MGHFIELIEGGFVVATTYLSFNWSMEPGMKTIFDVGDIHGHSGINGVIQKLENVLSTLFTFIGYNPDINKIKVDFWGHQKEYGIKLTDEELAKQKGHMFTHHVDRLLQLARQYPYAYWYSDQVWTISQLYEHVGVEYEQSEDIDFWDQEVQN